MDKQAKFEEFLESLKGHEQDTLIESVKEGFKVFCEAYHDIDVYELIDILEETPEKNRMELVKQFPSGFKVLFQVDPHAIEFFPKEVRLTVLNQFSDSFSQGFSKKPSAIMEFEMKDRLVILSKYFDSFKIAYEKYPELLNYFPEEKQEIIKKNIEE